MREAWTYWGKRAAAIFAGVVVAFALFLAFLLVTGPGNALLARMITPLSGGDVVVQGLTGSLPNHLRAARVELRDKKGVWLRLEGVTLDWHVLALLGNHVDIENARVTKLSVLRRQIKSETKSESTIKIDVAQFSVPRIELAAPVLGHEAVLSASGSLHYVSRHDVAANIAIRRLDGEGRYDVNAAIVRDIARGEITIAESGNGLAGGIAGMPDFGPVTLDLRAEAETSANRIRLKLTAGLLDVFGEGTLDLAARQADLDFSAVSPEMHPNPQLSWKLISAKGHLRGSFDHPDIDASLKVDGLEAGSVKIGVLEAELIGQSGGADLRATATGLKLPGAAGALASAPLTLTAHADLRAASRPVRFAVDHPLLGAEGTIATAGPLNGSAALTLHSLKPLGIGANGTASLTLAVEQLAAVTRLKAEGRIAAKGNSALARLLGGDARLEASAMLRDHSTKNLFASAMLSGAAVSAKVDGRVTDGEPNFRAEVKVSDLSRATASLKGTLGLNAQLNGPADNLLLVVNGDLFAAAGGMDREHVAINAEARGLPKLEDANVRLSGRFAGAPLSLKAVVSGGKSGAIHAALDRAEWKSATAKGSVMLAGSKPHGNLTLAIASLADLSPFAGQELGGRAEAEVDFKSSVAIVDATVSDFASGTTKIAQLKIGGSIADPFGAPDLALTLAAEKLASGNITGSATAQLKGPLDRLGIALSSALSAGEGQDFSLVADALLDTKAQHVTLNSFEGNWHGQILRLAEPASVDYGGEAVHFAAVFAEGKAARLTVKGFVPSQPGGAMHIEAKGDADLGTLASGLAAYGQNLRGKLALDITATGSFAKPHIVGTVQLADGQLRDYARGVSLTDIAAALEAQGTTIRLSRFTAKAGTGKIEGSGTVDLAAPGMPVDIAFKADDARPIVSDLMTATMDSDLKLAGLLREHLTLSGTLKLRKGTINLPKSLPAEVPTLDVRRPGRQAPPPPQRPAKIALDLTISSPGRIFVRGRGIEAEFEGDLKLKGTAANPRAEGALTMRRGTLSLAGTTLTFQSGSIGFNGTALRGRLDPTLNFVAQTTANGITATLKITGTASQPQVTLSSSPQLPQDEVLAQLLFQSSVKQLSPLQLAEMAQAIGALGGVGSGFDPLGVMRRSLGLDRLSVGNSSGAKGAPGETTIEAGKYVMHNVYVGARQGLSGGTKALVQVDLTKHLKVQATVTSGAHTSSSSLQDEGDSIGLSYEFEY